MRHAAMKPKSSGRNRVRIAGVVLAIAAYCSATAWVHLNRPTRSATTILALRYLLLLPALIGFTRRRNGGAAHVESGEPGISEVYGTPFLASVRVQAAVFVLAAAPLAWYWGRGQTVSDESGYRFQARIFSTGRMAAVGLPMGLDDFRPTVGNEHPLTGSISYGSRWFSKYPPGWPAVLAVADLLGVGWLASLLLGGGILLLTGAFAASVFNQRTARLAVLISIASPYFLYNSMGYLSHPLCGILIAAAAYFWLLGMRSQSTWPYWAMFAALAAAIQVRPFTAFLAGLVLGPVTLWQVRKDTKRLGTVLVAATICGACTVGAMSLYDHALTGSYWRSPYALARGLDFPIEVTPSFTVLKQNALYLNRWSLEATAVYSFPFLFLLAAWSVVKESRQRIEVAVLGLLYAAIVAGYLVQREWSTCQYGERYYFEMFFAAAILAARGLDLLSRDARWSARSLSHASLGLLAVQACAFAIFTPTMLGLTSYSAKVQEAFKRVTSPRTVVFLQDPPTIDYINAARNFNPNAADWQNAPAVYLPDPGLERRDAVTRLLGRSRWVVFQESAAPKLKRLD